MACTRTRGNVDGKGIPIRQCMPAVGNSGNPSPYAMDIGTHPSVFVGLRSSMGRSAASGETQK